MTRDLRQFGRNAGPFSIRLDDMPRDAAEIHCTGVVRVLPGKRLVCKARWMGQVVFAKLYFGPRWARRDWQRELRGITALKQHAIAAPEIIHSGDAAAGRIHVILFEPLPSASGLHQAWRLASGDDERLALLGTAVGVIARHHAAGLEQTDIHLDNFVLSTDRLYTLDGGGIRISGSGELPRRRSLDNLALFFAQFYPQYEHLIKRVVSTYVKHRGWPPGAEDRHGFMRRIARRRRGRQRKWLKKIFRDCSAFECKQSFRRFMVCDREMMSPGLAALLANPDAGLQDDGTRLLKAGNTCTVWATRVDGRALVVKRYNRKGVGHALYRACRRTRAAVSWKNAQRLVLQGIPTARPVALLEERLGPLRGRAWFVAEYVAGDTVLHLCEQQQAETGVTGKAVVSLLEQLARGRISHGDMKASNIILSDRGPVIVDLDAMKSHASALFYRRRQRRDLDRFILNWKDCRNVREMFQELIEDSALLPPHLS